MYANGRAIQIVQINVRQCASKTTRNKYLNQKGDQRRIMAIH